MATPTFPPSSRPSPGSTSPPSAPSAPSVTPDDLAELLAEVVEWRRRAEVAEARAERLERVAEECGEHLAHLRRLGSPLTAAPIGDGQPHDRMTAPPIPAPVEEDTGQYRRWWRR